MSTRILLIEDDEMVRSFMALHLKNEGYEPVEAGTGGDGLNLLQSGGAQLVLLDLNLPDGDGLTVAQRIREVSSVPIIVLTIRSAQDDRLMALGLGADEFLTKPVDPEELLLRVRNMVARAGSSPPAPTRARTPSPTPIGAPAEAAPSAAPAPAAGQAPKRGIGAWLTAACAVIAVAGVGWVWWDRSRDTGIPVASTAADLGRGNEIQDLKRLPEVEDDTRLAATSFSWVLKSKCDQIPYVSWWRVRSHADIVSYVNRRYAGDWKPYIQEWTSRLVDLQDAYSKSRGVRTPDGEVMTGVVLNAHIAQTQKRLDVILCLSKEAAEYSHQKNQPVR